MPAITNHLWQSTIFFGSVALAAIALRNHAARVRYWLWLAASLKFLVPFSILVSLGSRIDVRSSSPVSRVAVERVSSALIPATEWPVVASAPTESMWPAVLAAL